MFQRMILQKQCSLLGIVGNSSATLVLSKNGKPAFFPTPFGRSLHFARLKLHGKQTKSSFANVPKSASSMT